MTNDEAVRLTPEQVEQTRDALKALVALQPGASPQVYERAWKGIDKLCDLALIALRSDRDAIIEEEDEDSPTLEQQMEDIRVSMEGCSDSEWANLLETMIRNVSRALNPPKEPTDDTL